MATINRQLADKLVKGNGKSKEGTAGYVLVRYQNRLKYDIPGVDMYDPDAENNVFDYAIFPDKAKYELFIEDENVGGVDILWGSKRFHKDELKREQNELEAEFENLAPVIEDLHFFRSGHRERGN